MSYDRALLLSWSGGKDAAWALHTLRRQAQFEVVGLFTTFTREHDRVSMQGIRRDVVHAQAEAAGLPLIEAFIPAQSSNDDYEAALKTGLDAARQIWPEVRTMAFGDLLLEDIRRYRVGQFAQHQWNVLTPLFGTNTFALAKEMIEHGLRASVCCVDTTQLDASYAGRDFDRAYLAELPTGIDPCGENGEFHTCVHDGPMFMKPIQLRRGESVLRDNRFMYTDFILEAPPMEISP